METSKRAINITHYINPHMFWFRYDISYVEGNSKINILDQKIKKYLQENEEEFRSVYYDKNGYVPQVGEVIILLFLCILFLKLMVFLLPIDCRCKNPSLP